MDERRLHILNDTAYAGGPVIYWMSRDQRARDNWALVYARSRALEYRAGLLVFFCLSTAFLGARKEHYAFMLEGLREVEADLRSLGIPFFLKTGDPMTVAPAFMTKMKAGLVVTDFDPLRIKRRWRESLADGLRAPVHEIDAHNVVPCRAASPKQEYGAHTLRKKLQRLLPEFLVPVPALKKFNGPGECAPVDWERAYREAGIAGDGSERFRIKSGPRGALRAMRRFLERGLGDYSWARNDPSAAGQSGLSPYLHFGQLSAQRLALEASRSAFRGRDDFLEQLVVRRELSDNYCLHNPHYDSFEGIPAWARKTLDRHRGDRREYVYRGDELEFARTHDPLWNAAQTGLLRFGTMHGYLRMYWAKKILEWSASPEEAYETAVSLNDRYQLDGRDPNGYAGIAWSIGGAHDRPWAERPVFGMIRYMSFNGCKSKFNIRRYIESIENA